jgi:hypothetical protein
LLSPFTRISPPKSRFVFIDRGDEKVTENYAIEKIEFRDIVIGKTKQITPDPTASFIGVLFLEQKHDGFGASIQQHASAATSTSRIW